MSIIMKDQQNRSQLQERIAAELREKRASGKLDGDIRAPEFDIEKSEYLKDRGGDTPVPGWVWMVGLLVTATVVLLLVKFVI